MRMGGSMASGGCACEHAGQWVLQEVQCSMEEGGQGRSATSKAVTTAAMACARLHVCTGTCLGL